MYSSCTCACRRAVQRAVLMPSSIAGLCEAAPLLSTRRTLIQLRTLSTNHRTAAWMSSGVSRPIADLQLTASMVSPITPSRRSSSTLTMQISQLTDRKYHELSDATMELLTERLEEIQEELGNSDFDVEYSSGVLTLRLPDGKGTYVINKQPPNKQIWLSSPTSGPKRYDWSDDSQAWFYARDDSIMLELLESELSEKLGIEAKLR